MLKTKGPRILTQEQREQNARRQREYRERKKAQLIAEKDSWGGLFSIKPNLYTKTRDDEVKSHIGAILNMKPIHSAPKKPPSAIDKRAPSIKSAADQLTHAHRNLGSGFTIRFDHLDPDGVEYMRRNLGKLLDRFVKSIDYSDKWVAVYQYGSETSRIRPIDEITSAQLYNQLFDEGFIDPGTVEYIDPFESGGAFIPFLIDSLNSLKFINLKYHNLDGNALAAVTRKLSPFTKKSLHAAMVQNDLKLDAASLAKLEEALSRKSKNTRHEGKFWPYKLTIPHVNLERQMIFGAIDQKSVKAIEGDNCLIYACKMAGVSESKLNHMRNVIRIRSFSLAKLGLIANECELRFTVYDVEGKTHRIGPEKGTPINLLLFEGHYMLNERIPVSPFFIKNHSEILRAHQTRWWTLSEKQRTRGRKSTGEFVKPEKTDFKLITVLRAIFSVGGFTEIRYGDYMTFSSTLYASKLKAMINLSYEPRYCCRLKVNPTAAKGDGSYEEEMPL